MKEYIQLLRSLIQTQSFSKEEEQAATLIRKFLMEKGISFQTKINNTWAKNHHWTDGLPVVLLNSHVDTVRPAHNWTKDPFGANMEGDCLCGLGSNDAGASLVTLLAVFVHFNQQENLPFNLIYAASAEEEISGLNGMESLIGELGKVDLAIVGEPTQMQMAIAEKGLMVLDCTAHGKSGHAARNEGENALYKAIEDIQKLRGYRFEKVSKVLGEVKLSVTQINAGYQHNVVPDQCTFVVDVRTNEHYSNQKVLKMVRSLIGSEVVARSFRLNSSGISADHPIVKRGTAIGLSSYGSPTTSDQAVMPFNSIKIGPGNSARSHTADEYIRVSEIEEGFKTYVSLLDGLEIK
jgi:acetylornithine deacetylase